MIMMQHKVVHCSCNNDTIAAVTMSDTKTSQVQVAPLKFAIKLANFSPKTISLPVTNPGPTYSNLKHVFEEMCKYPHCFNIFGGLAFFSINSNSRHDLNLSFLSIPLFTFIAQTFIEIFFCYYYFRNIQELSLLAHFAQTGAHNIDRNKAEHFVETSLVILGITGQFETRLVYLLKRNHFLDFHRKLEELSLKWTLNEEEGQQEFRKLALFMRRVARPPCVLAPVSVFGFAVFIYLTVSRVDSGHVLQPFSIWERVLISFLLFDVYIVAHPAYTYHALWFALYIKWMELLFRFTRRGRESSPQGKDKLTELSELENIVQEFNQLFHIPIIVYLFINCAGVTTLLFFILSWLKSAHYQIAVTFLPPALAKVVAVWFLAGVGTSFNDNVGNV